MARCPEGRAIHYYISDSFRSGFEPLRHKDTKVHKGRWLNFISNHKQPQPFYNKTTTPNFAATLTYMPHFTKRVSTDDGVVNFYFNRVYTVNGIKYHISVTKKQRSHYFMMEDGEAGWHFSDITSLPEWIIELEKKLETAIVEHGEEV